MSNVIYGKNIKSVSILWADSILNGKYTFSDVPRLLKGEVAYYLVSKGNEVLIQDEEYKAAAIEEYNTNKNNSKE